MLYLMFNEGYSACSGNELIRAGLCDEAIRLTRVRLAKGSVSSCASATTRLAIEPTVHQAIRRSSSTADFEVCVASQASWSSKLPVWPESVTKRGSYAAAG